MSVKVEVPQEVLTREIRALTIASGFVGEAIGTCPVDQLGWERSQCEDDCGSAGRDGDDNFVRCWREYFIETAEKKGEK